MKTLKPIAALLVLWAHPSWGASIGLFSTPDCSSCNLRVPPGGVATLYIRALTDGIPSWTQMGGATFRVTGLPAGWVAISTPNPETNSIGDPFGHGIWDAFIRIPSGSCVPLYTVVLAAPPGGPPTEGVLQVTQHELADPRFPCPAFTLDCGAPCDIFDPFCVAGGTMLLNSSRDCRVGVEPTTWSRIKLFYER